MLFAKVGLRSSSMHSTNTFVMRFYSLLLRLGFNVCKMLLFQIKFNKTLTASGLNITCDEPKH
jgi:hypothetical protein